MGDNFRTIMAAIVAVLLALPSGAQTLENDRPDRINGKPNLNGIWQAMNTAYWNLEAHSAESLPEFWELGAFGAIPAGQSVVQGGEIPYRPEAEAERNRNRENWPQADPAAKCYMPGIPRANYMPYPFQIAQGDGDIFFSYAFATANRTIHMGEDSRAPVDQWMGWSTGHWEGDTLVVKVTDNDRRTWLDRSGNHHSGDMTVTERFTKISDNHIRYEATIEDPKTFTRPWTIEMILYRKVAPQAELVPFNCVEFSEELLYGHLEAEPRSDAKPAQKKK